MKTTSELQEDARRPWRRAAMCAIALTLAAGTVTVDLVPRSRELAMKDAGSPPPPAAPRRLSASELRSEPASPPRLLLPAAEPDAGLREDQLRDAIHDTHPWAIPDPEDGGKTPPYDVALTTWSSPRRWSGFYVGFNAGGAVGRSTMRTGVDSGSPANYFLTSDIAQIDGIGTLRGTPSGFTGGLQAGYNFQADAVVYGLEADFDSMNLSDSRTFTAGFTGNPGTSFRVNQALKTDWLFTLRPRIGLATDHFLVFGTAGLAATRLKYSEQYTDTFNRGAATGSFAETRFGWAAGAGCEYMLSRHWTVKGEYLYADFGAMAANSVLVVPPGRGDQFDHSVSLTAHLVRLGFNYKF